MMMVYILLFRTAGYIEGSEKQDKMPNGSNVVTMDLSPIKLSEMIYIAI